VEDETVADDIVLDWLLACLSLFEAILGRFHASEFPYGIPHFSSLHVTTKEAEFVLVIEKPPRFLMHLSASPEQGRAVSEVLGILEGDVFDGVED